MKSKTAKKKTKKTPAKKVLANKRAKAAAKANAARHVRTGKKADTLPPEHVKAALGILPGSSWRVLGDVFLVQNTRAEGAAIRPVAKIQDFLEQLLASRVFNAASPPPSLPPQPEEEPPKPAEG